MGLRFSPMCCLLALPECLLVLFLFGKQVMEIWATYYGAEAGVMGLRCIPTGGLFLAGGMTHKLIHLVEVGPAHACE